MLATLPAKMVIHRVLPVSTSSIVQYHDISGSIWKGQATQFTVKQIPLGKLEWALSSLPLLWGTADLQLTARREGSLIITDAAISPDKISLKDTRFEMAIADLMPLLYGYPISIDGKINALFQNIEIAPASRFVINGRAVLTDIETVAPQALSLGNLVLNFEENENGTRITVNDQQGPVQVDAVITLAETGFYTVNATLIPQATADPAIKNMLLMFSKADNQGRHTINTRGRIPLRF
ncbi:MAG: type II secretion system protein N [Gammaproteobacteria bacterium]